MKLFFKYIGLIAASIFLFCSCHEAVVPDKKENIQPVIFPDYSGVTFPINIAPPNFAIKEPGEAFYVEIGANGTTQLSYHLSEPIVKIKEAAWHKFANQVAGSEYFTRIFIKRNGKWIQFEDIINQIAKQPIDPYLVYRLLYPGYELWNEMGIYQRDLTSFEETAVVENKSLERSCVNCHTFCKNSPDTMLLHIRGKMGGTVIRKGSTTVKKDTKTKDIDNRGAYASWHPTGRFIAYSANEVKQFFHLTGKKPVEVSDLVSDLVIYDVEADQLFTSPSISGPEFMETYPNWSPDGKTLYFCRTNNIQRTTPLDSIRYDLYRVSFDPETKKIGTPECIYNASEKGKTLALPRVSPDGKYLMFSFFDYGNFGIWHPESDLCLLDLTTGTMRIMDEVNSDNVESFHTWSSSGNWFVFSSKRMDGLWARPYFAFFDSQTGKAGKPFVLPQEDPYFYDNYTKTFNLPELVKGPIKEKRKFYQTKIEHNSPL